jgi:hypothetical protein
MICVAENEKRGGPMVRGREARVAFVLLACALAQCQGSRENKAEEAEILTADDHYTHGSLHKDLAELNSVWAESFVDTSGAVVRNKSEMLKTIKNGPKLESITIDDRKVQVYGGAAVVTGRYTAMAIENGKKVSGSGRFTDVWVKQNGTWLCVAAHSSKIGP